MRKFKVLKLPNVSESAGPIYYKRKRYTNVLFHKMFFQKNGGGPGGPTQAQSACPHFWEKHFDWKELLCTVCVCKEWDCRFWNILLTTIWICASLSIFSLQKDGIHVMWTLIASKKVNPCSFCACVLLQKKTFHSFQRLFLTCKENGNVFRSISILENITFIFLLRLQQSSSDNF